jgi:beta-galactosidase
MDFQPCNTGWEFRPRGNPFQEGFREHAPWVGVHLPHDALIDAERHPDHGPASGYFPGGAFEYRTTLAVPTEWRDRWVTLRFEGVHRGAMVYVNEQLAASRPYGYSEFSVALDPFLRHGEDNVIEVQSITGSDSRWYTGAGIYREVALAVADPVHVALDGLFVTTPEIDDDGAVTVVAVEVDNDTRHTRTVTATTSILDGDGAVVARAISPVTVAPGSRSVAVHRMHLAHPRRWDLDDPYQYCCESTLHDGDQELDRAETRFGIRQLQLDPLHGLRLNGTSVKLRGTCLHHDNGILGAATIRRADERRIEILKSAGFNAVRSAHQPMSRALLDACDRLGMLVMDETFDVWTRSKSDDDYARSFGEWWEADVEAMVRKDRNRPSVVMYSIGNEIQDTGTPLGAALGRRIAEKVKQLDPTRYTTNSVNALLSVGSELFAAIGADTTPATADAPSETRADDRGVNTLLTTWSEFLPRLLQRDIVADRTAESFAAVDVAGYNYMDSRYVLDGQIYPNRVIVGSETFPAEIGRNWPLIQANPHVIGEFTWVGWDYLGEAGVGRTEYANQPESERTGQFLGPYPWIFAGSGDIGITGVRRPISYYREIVFGLRAEPFIAVDRPAHHGETVTHTSPWAWPDVISSWTWPGREGRPVRVEVYSASDEVELLRDGEPVGRAATGPAAEFMASFVTEFQPGELTAVAYVDGVETGRTVLRSAAAGTKLAVDVDRDVVVADDGDLAFLAIAIVDDAGELRPDADRPVSVEVDGPAILQGFGSADPTPRTSYRQASRSTHDGRALAIVRPTGTGTVTVRVRAEGCEPVELALRAMDRSEIVR